MGSGAASQPGQRREQVERRETTFAHFEPHVQVSLSLDCNTPSQTSLRNCGSKGKRHLEFACSLARLQIVRGGRVLFEHPLAASEEPCLWKLRSIDGMRCVRCDQCQFGMTSVDNVGNVGPACKATGFMTNDEYIAEAVDRHCFGGHDHNQLLSGRAKTF